MPRRDLGQPVPLDHVRGHRVHQLVPLVEVLGWCLHRLVGATLAEGVAALAAVAGLAAWVVVRGAGVAAGDRLWHEGQLHPATSRRLQLIINVLKSLSH